MSGCIKVSNQSKYAKLIDVVLHVTVWAVFVYKLLGELEVNIRKINTEIC